MVRLLPMLLVIMCSQTELYSLGSLNLIEAEDSLFRMYERLYDLDKDEEKLELNAEIVGYFEGILKSPLSFSYAFDSLVRIGNIEAPDKEFRLFTWNLPMSDNTQVYFGLIQTAGKKKNGPEVIILTDRSAEINDPVSEVLAPENWFGALYYEVLLQKYKGNVFYTLLGFDFNDPISNKKIIDILSFDGDGRPYFGMPVIQTEEGIRHRVIFQYSGDVVMTLRYHPGEKMIIFDHLEPIDPALTGSFQFYAPDFTYDAFQFKKGNWIYLPDVDIRNR